MSYFHAGAWENWVMAWTWRQWHSFEVYWLIIIISCIAQLTSYSPLNKMYYYAIPTVDHPLPVPSPYPTLTQGQGVMEHTRSPTGWALTSKEIRTPRSQQLPSTTTGVWFCYHKAESTSPVHLQVVTGHSITKSRVGVQLTVPGVPTGATSECHPPSQMGANQPTIGVQGTQNTRPPTSCEGSQRRYKYKRFETNLPRKDDFCYSVK